MLNDVLILVGVVVLLTLFIANRLRHLGVQGPQMRLAYQLYSLRSRLRQATEKADRKKALLRLDHGISNTIQEVYNLTPLGILGEVLLNADLPKTYWSIVLDNDLEQEKAFYSEYEELLYQFLQDMYPSVRLLMWVAQKLDFYKHVWKAIRCWSPMWKIPVESSEPVGPKPPR